MRKTITERFESKIIKTESGCWEYDGTHNQIGYGIFYPERKSPIVAHRFSYELYIKEIPEGLFLDHLCRNRGCINPEHLEPVTHKENVNRGLRTKIICEHGNGISNCYSVNCNKKYRKNLTQRRK